MSLESIINMEEKEKIKFMNTLGRKLEVFKPIDPSQVKLYTCGPTVYARAHIGNLRAYVFADVLRKTLEYAGYDVKHVMNITDVGHLTSDADSGEDKMQKAARETGNKSLDIAEKWTRIFFQDIDRLNIEKANILCKATDHIQEQIDLVKRLEKKGYTYKTSDGVYFDTSKFPRYAELGKLDIEGLSAGKRISIGEKRNKTDFALWKFSKEGEQRDLEWDSPWGTGFPGWHIECSAMCIKYLGETIDIHTGGIDHIPIHHTNEIAQSECATGKKFANYWLHSDFLTMSEDEKMSKSKGNIVDLDTLEKDGFSPLVYRYLCLNSHYRKQLIYGREILQSASNAYQNVKNRIKELGIKEGPETDMTKLSDTAQDYLSQFKDSVFNDLNTPQGLAVMWGVLKDGSLGPEEKYSLACNFDKIFSLGIKEMAQDDLKIPASIEKLALERQRLREEKRWSEADQVRDEISSVGYNILDTSEGYKLEKKN
jgi:cysteinyl-tRNA synthetase